MSVLPIVTLPNPILRQVSAPVERIDPELLRLADDMLETMYDAPGCGLAAVQVGVPRRMFVLDCSSEDEPRQPLVLINPEIVVIGPQMRAHEEGCLSIPEFKVEIERPSSLRIKYLDREGKQQEQDAEGLLATAIQHEYDHLQGKMIIDYLTSLKRDMVIRKFKKIARHEGDL
ncbi:MAG: peptide deformylase [Hyphomicrobium sp.]